MGKLLTFLKPYKMPAWWALALTVFELGVELVQPIIMAIIIDQGIVKGNLSPVIHWGLLLLGLSFVAFISGIINSFYSSEVSQGIGHDLRRELYKKIQEFSLINFQAFPTSSLITRLTNDVTQIQNFIFMSLRIGLRAPLFILGGMIMAFTVHVPLALILLITVPVLFIIVFWILKKGIYFFQLVQKKLDLVNGIIRENLMAMLLIKAFTRGKYEEERFDKVNTTLNLDNKKALRLMELTSPILLFGMNVSMVFILWFGSVQINTGGAQAGEVVAILNYATRIMFTFTMFSFLLMNYSRGQASSERIMEVLEEKTDQHLHAGSEKMEKMKGSLEFEHVCFKYPTSNDFILHDLSFKMKAGETVGILGETGSGKSSLFQLIPRLYDVTAGHIFVDGVDMRDLKVQELRKQIGLVPQEAHLFTGSIKDNIGWGKDDVSMDEIIQAAKDAEIHDFIMGLPNQYDTLIGQKGVNFSGGQKQRLSIARALVRRPGILLLDDSTSALDAQTEAKILESLKQQECTTLIIAQKISSVKEADKILLLHEGKLLDQGSHETLLEKSSYYQRIYQSQAQKEVGQFA